MTFSTLATLTTFFSMEILFITHKYPPSVGGMEKQSFELTQRMKKHAVVHLLCCANGESKLHFFWQLKRNIQQKLDQHPGISMLHFNDGLAAAFCSGTEDFPGILRTVTLHGLDVVYPNAFFQKKILPRIGRFQGIIAVSQATAAACVERGIDPQKVHVIPNGVDHDLADYVPKSEEQQQFQRDYNIDFNGKRTLILMGRPVLRKGFSWFLRSVFPLLEKDFQVLIIGPFRREKPFSATLLKILPATFRKQLELLFGMPSDEDAVRDLLKSPELKGRVQHLGKLPLSDIMQIMSASTAFLMPNIQVEGDMEGFGLVCLEANLRGLPVIAANLEGITDAVQDGKNGWLLPSQNVGVWVAALSKLDYEPAASTAFGQQARQYVLDHFGWEKMTAEYYQYFEELLTKSRPNPL